VIPLAAIVMAFVWTLGSRKLQLSEGRTLKLLSGSMMLGLGVLLLVAPDQLERIGAAIAVVLVAIAFTGATVLVGRRRRTAPPSASWDT
jgi:drug/metabolite transporter (DMT)-like permease